MATTTERPRRYAVLIDADNAQASTLKGILGEVAKLGEAAVKRIYGDFTSPHSNSWKPHLNAHAIKPVQQFAYTTGKNATDIALIIDAMDLMYTRRFDGFVLVSSDSDFTSLASRLREEGLETIGFGRQTTPQAFRNACNRFVLTEVLRPSADTEDVQPPVDEVGRVGTASPPASVPSVVPPLAAVSPEPFPLEFIRKGIEQTSDEGGWVRLSKLGSYLRQLQPDFDERRYGFKLLNQLLRSRPQSFEVRAGEGPQGSKVLSVKLKTAAKGKPRAKVTPASV